MMDESNNIIQITNQSCFQQEKYFEDGKQKLVFVVVKNQPFRLIVELTDKGNQLDLDIRNFEWTASLVYNVEDKKEVPFINQEPFTYKFSHFNEKKISVECRIVVLTSQHEDVFFLIRIRADSKDSQKIPHIYTCPIKVISKPEQPKKRKVITENLKPQKKRQTKAEKLLQILQEIQQKQIKQEENFHYLKQKLLNLNNNNMNMNMNMNMGMNMNGMNNMGMNMSNMNMNNNNMNMGIGNMNMNTNQNFVPPQNVRAIPQSFDTNKIKKEKLEFEPLLHKLLELYNRLPLQQKKEKLQNAIKRLPTTFLMREFYDILIGEGLENDSSKLNTSNNSLENSVTWNIPGMQEENGSLAPLSSKTVTISPGFEFEFLDFEENPTHCTCEVCPYKQELERIESFTKEIFPGN